MERAPRPFTMDFYQIAKLVDSTSDRYPSDFYDVYSFAICDRPIYNVQLLAMVRVRAVFEDSIKRATRVESRCRE